MFVEEKAHPKYTRNWLILVRNQCLAGELILRYIFSLKFGWNTWNCPRTKEKCRHPGQSVGENSWRRSNTSGRDGEMLIMVSHGCRFVFFNQVKHLKLCAGEWLRFRPCFSCFANTGASKIDNPR